MPVCKCRCTGKIACACTQCSRPCAPAGRAVSMPKPSLHPIPASWCGAQEGNQAACLLPQHQVGPVDPEPWRLVLLGAHHLQGGIAHPTRYPPTPQARDPAEAGLQSKVQGCMALCSEEQSKSLSPLWGQLLFHYTPTRFMSTPASLPTGRFC